MTGCFAWITRGRRTAKSQLMNGSIVPFLPDDIIINILNRLPLGRVLELSSVCKHWKALIFSPHFAKLQLKRVTTPTILVNYLDSKSKETPLSLMILREGSKDKPIVLSRHQEFVLCSCDGLLLSMSFDGMTFFFPNPVCPFNRVPVSKTPGGGIVIGFFFHPRASEYKLLYMKKEEGKDVRYFIYSARAKLWKELFTQQSSSVGTSLSFQSPPVVNGALHWILKPNEHISASGDNAILVFKIDDEEFLTMPSPLGERYCKLMHLYNRMHLLVKEGRLSFCFVDIRRKFIDMWMLEDYEDHTWVHRYKIDIDFSPQIFPCDYECVTADCLRVINLLDIWNEELILDWSGRGIFRCHLTNSIVHKFNSLKRSLWIKEYYFSGAFTKSLVDPMLTSCW